MNEQERIKLARRLTDLAKQIVSAQENEQEGLGEDPKFAELKKLLTPSNLQKLAPKSRKKINTVLPDAPMIRPNRATVGDLLEMVVKLINAS